MSKPVVEVKNLRVSFRTNQGFVHAVRDVSFTLYEGETLAIVGESGSGKSQTCRSIMGILAGNAVVDSGEILYEGQNLLDIPEDEYHKIRGRKIGMIFQDPTSALNPIMRVGKQIVEAMVLNGHRKEEKYRALFLEETVKVANINKDIVKVKKSEDQSSLAELKTKLKIAKAELKVAKKKAKETINIEYNGYKETYKKDKKALFEKHKKAKTLKQYFVERTELKETYKRLIKVTNREGREEAYKIMEEVGIPEPEKRFKMYPFQFSGGMKQRIVIAIALMAHPDILICDEPTTALDVTIQDQILDLLKRIKKNRNLTLLFITHNLGVVANVADRVAVMYAGKVVEYGTLDEIFYNPKHPYTWALMTSMPDVNSKEKLLTISGTPPNMLYPPKGDAFAQRNPHALQIDFEEHPPFFKVSDTHYAATWLLHPDAPKVELPEIITSRAKAMSIMADELKRRGAQK
ncbi:MAG: ATP-binding cassette domain-containing protein [Erysipelotrichaceae bacterium]|nr:ATP-binding cassette domain-containing protein [Acholeplasmataceae bacterium]MDD3924469.1 ATP-binding cassette domain-containing protein [Erysipelotrichaceae bacterium]